MSVLQISQTLHDTYANVLVSPTYYTYAQSFLAESNFDLDTISIQTDLTGDPGLMTMTLHETNKPENAIVPTNIIATATATQDDVGPDGWTDFIFSTPLPVTNGTTYWILVRPANINALRWNMQSTDVYANGCQNYFWMGDWFTDSTADLTFKIYGNANSSFVSPLPTFFR